MTSTAVKLMTVLRPKGLAYLIKAEFPTDAAAPMGTNPVIYGPEASGVGELWLQQKDAAPSAQWRVVGGVLETTASSDSVAFLPAVSTASSFARAAGLALKARTAQNPQGPGPNETVSPIVGWTTARGTGAAVNHTGVLLWTGINALVPIDRDATVVLGIDAAAANTFYDIAVVLRAAGSFVVVGNKLVGINDRESDAVVWPHAIQLSANRHTPRLDYFRVAQLGGVWKDDFGIATTRLAGARSAGDVFAHEPNALWLRFTLTALPASGNIDIDFRRQDANNCWRLRVTSAGELQLIEVVGGTPTVRANIASNVAGDRLECVMDGAQARLGRFRAGGGAQSSIYSSVTTFTTQTSGIIATLGTGGAISDLVTWPRNLTGEALAWINAL